MSKRAIAAIAASVVAFVVGQSTARAQDEGGGMGAMPKWMAKTDVHAGLAKTAGEFDIESEFSMAPGAPMQKGKATAKREMILNGMFLRETFKMNFMGMPFEGHLITGWDAMHGKLVSIWVDNSAPAAHVSYGVEKDGKIIFEGAGPNQMTGKSEPKKMVIENMKDDTWNVNFFDVKDGKDVLTMKMAYTRKKPAAEAEKAGK